MKRECIILLLVIVFFVINFITFVSAFVDDNQNINPDNINILNSDIMSVDANANQISSVASSLGYKYQGYIVQFEDTPIAVKEKELKDNAKANEARIKSLGVVGGVYGAFVTKEKDVPEKIESYRNEIKNNKEIIKSKISDVIAGNVNSVKPSLWNLFGLTGRAVSSSREIDETAIFAEWDSVFNGIALNVSDSQAEEIKKISGVKSVSPNLIVHAELMDSVPLIGADKVWQLDADGNNCATSGKECLTGKGVKIGIIDTGIDYTHADLGGCFGANCKVMGGYDFVNNDNNPMDDQGHGTHVSGIAAGSGLGGLKGVAPDAKLYAYKVLNSAGSGYFDDAISAIEMSMDPNQDGDFSDHLDVISMSFGAANYYWCFNDDVGNVINNAINLGISVVIAAGNDGYNGNNTISYPGCMERAITVGSATKYSAISSFSSRGFGLYNGIPILKPDISAPGSNICSAEYDSAWDYARCLDNKHVSISGTSMATPHVAGAAALVKQAFPNLKPDEIKALLMNYADKNYFYSGNSYTYFDTGTGFLRINNSIKSFLSNKIIVNTASINFGVVDSSQNTWTISKKINLTNYGNSPVSATIILEGSFPASAGFTYPSSITINPGENYFNFVLSIPNSLNYGNYQGAIVINYGKIIKVPFFFKKAKINVLTDPLANSKIDIEANSDVPFFINNAYIIRPDSSRENIILREVDFQNYIGNYTPSIFGNHIIKIEARDYRGNWIYGNASFLFDNIKPNLNLSIENSKTIVLNASENIEAIWIEKQLTKIGANEGSNYGTLKTTDNKTYVAYVWNGEFGFSTPFNIYSKEYNPETNNIENQKTILDGTVLFNKLNNLINRPHLGYSVFIYNQPIILENSFGDIYSVFGYETNNMYCGVKGMGIKKLNKTSNQWQELNDTLYVLDTCTNDIVKCQDPASHRNEWCDAVNGKEEARINRINAKIDKDDNINIFWTEDNGFKIIGDWIAYNSVLYYKKLDKNANIIVNKEKILEFNNPNNIPAYYIRYDFDIDSNNNIYLVWSESIKNGSRYASVPDMQTYYKIFNSSTQSWENFVNITTPYVNVYQMNLDKDSNMHILYDLDHGGNYYNFYYGTINQTNKTVNQIRLLKDYWGNKDGRFSIGDNKNVYIGDLVPGPHYSLGLDYNFYNFKNNSWTKGDLLKRSDWDSISGTGLDKINNFYSIFSSDTDPSNKLIYNIFMKRYTNPPSLILTKKDSTKELVELTKVNNLWKANLSSVNDIYFIEAYATDLAGNTGYAKLGLSGNVNSKISNIANSILSGNLTLRLQKNISGTWVSVTTFTRPVSIPGNGYLNLATGKDNLGNQRFEGFNFYEIKGNSPGDYRVYAKFESNGMFKEANYEFKVG